jgi:hypothetical protein
LVLRESLPCAVSVHKLLQLCSLLDLEEDLSPVLGLDLDVDVGICSCLALIG